MSESLCCALRHCRIPFPAGPWVPKGSHAVHRMVEIGRELWMSPSLVILTMLNRIGCSIDPWGTPLATGIQLDFLPQVTNLWACLFSHFSIPLSACPAHTSSASVRGSYSRQCPLSTCTSVFTGLFSVNTEVQIDDVHFSPLICQAIPFITESYQVGWACLPRCSCQSVAGYSGLPQLCWNWLEGDTTKPLQSLSPASSGQGPIWSLHRPLCPLNIQFHSPRSDTRSDAARGTCSCIWALDSVWGLDVDWWT